MLVSIVLDGVGVGHGPDADAYGDAGSNTLAHVLESQRPALPNLERLGLGRVEPVAGVEPVEAPEADFGRMTEVSAGKDSTTGHWELAGIPLDRPFPTYPDGFPPEVVEAFLREIDRDGVLANVPASGTDVIETHGPAHQATGHPILYTSADSVFQIAAHVETVPLETLYAWCRVARERICVGEHAVGRVIARPFTGEPGAYVRLSDKRRDFSLAPTSVSVQERLQEAGIRTVAVGKIGDLFADVGFDTITKTTDNAQGITRTLEAINTADERTFIWTNLVDFDQLFGHRNDPAGFSAALEAFDAALPELIEALPPGARLVLTADHGNDPCFPGTDHTREQVPVLVYRKGGAGGRDLGTRATFADHAASVAAHFGVAYDGPGTSFIDA